MRVEGTIDGSTYVCYLDDDKDAGSIARAAAIIFGKFLEGEEPYYDCICKFRLQGKDYTAMVRVEMLVNIC